MRFRPATGSESRPGALLHPPRQLRDATIHALPTIVYPVSLDHELGMAPLSRMSGPGTDWDGAGRG